MPLDTQPRDQLGLDLPIRRSPMDCRSPRSAIRRKTVGRAGVSMARAKENVGTCDRGTELRALPYTLVDYGRCNASSVARTEDEVHALTTTIDKLEAIEAVSRRWWRISERSYIPERGRRINCTATSGQDGSESVGEDPSQNISESAQSSRATFAVGAWVVTD